MSAGAAGGQADFSEVRKTLSSNVVLHQSPDLPFGGEYHGHEGYETWAVRMSSLFDQLKVSERRFFEQVDAVAAQRADAGLPHDAGRTHERRTHRRVSAVLLERSS